MRMLLTPHEVATMLAADPAPVVLDARWKLSAHPEPGSQHADYTKGHIPGARFVDLETDLTRHPSDDELAAGQGGRHPLPDPEVFQAAMRRVGVRRELPIVVYDAGDSMAAARLWWLLTDAGHEATYVLDGGFAAWRNAGLEVEEGNGPDVEETGWVGAPGHRGRVDADGVDASVRAGYRVIDVRASERFEGLTEPLDPIAGHIPGAVNLPAKQFQNADGTFRPAEEIVAAVGTIREGDVLYCGSGITASMVLLALEASGVRGAVIYPGSWSEWSRQGRPVATGK